MNLPITYKSIWKVSYPIILSGIAQNIVNVTDTAFLGRVGAIEIGAAGNAGIFYFVILMLGLGFSTGSQIIIGRRNGESKYSEIGKLVENSLYFLIPLALLIFLFFQYLAPVLLSNLTKSPEILQASHAYLNLRSFGIIFAFINFSFIAFYVGIIHTNILIYSTIIQALTNVLFDYLLIFGHLGFPEMGIEGAALASVFSEVVAMLYFIAYTYLKVDRKKYELFDFHQFEIKKLKKMLKLSAPIMLQNFASLAAWLVFFMIIEQIGEEELAVSHIIRSIYMVMMIPMFGFSQATNTLVSNLIGKGRSQNVLTLVKKILFLSLACTTLFIPLNLFFPENILRIYTNDPNLIAASIPVLFVISASMLLFSVSYILFSAVSGTGKTIHSLFLELTSILIYLTGAYLLGVHFNFPVQIVWCSEFIYFGMMGILSYSYLKWGNWQNANV